MVALAVLMLFAAGPARVVFDEDLAVPRSRARAVPVQVTVPTYVAARYETRSDRAQVRAVLMTAADVHAFQEGESPDLLAATEYSRSGEFRFLVMRPGEYFVLIDNRRDEQPSQTVHVSVSAAEDPSLPGTLPASRRHAVVAISLTLFAIVAGWSGNRLRRGNARLFGSG